MKHVYGLRYLSVRERYEYLLVGQQSKPYLDLIATISGARDVSAINPRIAPTPSLQVLPLFLDLQKS